MIKTGDRNQNQIMSFTMDSLVIVICINKIIIIAKAFKFLDLAKIGQLFTCQPPFH